MNVVMMPSCNRLVRGFVGFLGLDGDVDIEALVLFWEESQCYCKFRKCEVTRKVEGNCNAAVTSHGEINGM